MPVYIIAASPDGPCKIGIAGDPSKRLKALQTGNPFPLTLYHVESVGNAAKAVERAVLQALSHRQCEGGEEWFNIGPAEARIQVRTAAATAGVFFDDKKTLYEIQDDSMQRWFGELKKLEDEWDEEAKGQFEEPPDGAPPSPFEMFAASVAAPAIRTFDFNDYLLTWDEGIRLRWAFEQNGQRMPSGRSLGPYGIADKLLEEKGFSSGRQVSKRWIEWGLARELTGDEVYSLGEIWNLFSTAYNAVEKSQHQAMRGDDCLDDVHLYVLSGNRKRGDRDRAVFQHDDFRVVLFSRSKVPLFRVDDSLRAQVECLDVGAVSGFVAPVLTSDVWERPFMPWISSAAQRRDVSLSSFVARPNKNYPIPREYDAAPPGTLIHLELPIDGPHDEHWM